jgi:hypothetical protein
MEKEQKKDIVNEILQNYNIQNKKISSMMIDPLGWNSSSRNENHSS